MSVLGISGGVLRRAAEIARPFGADGAELLTGRAALLGLRPAGQLSAGGATRLLRAADGWCALTLSRTDDVAAVPALVEADEVGDVWSDIAHWTRTRGAAQVVERAVLLDLPAARLGEAAAVPPRVSTCGTTMAPRTPAGLLVVDLTSMWAGPLCGQLLARAGATVVKVESPSRPDGTRTGDVRFFDWMNSGKLSCAMDFDRDRVDLEALLAGADVVLEGARPAALARRGLGPSRPGRPGRVWLRLSGYAGADGRPAFGDDAAVAGGLVGRDDDGHPVFVGDAIADPLTGLEAAAAVVASLARGGGELIAIAMSEVAATYAALPDGATEDADPVRPAVTGRASALGADAPAVRRLLLERAEC